MCSDEAKENKYGPLLLGEAYDFEVVENGEIVPFSLVLRVEEKIGEGGYGIIYQVVPEDRHAIDYLRRYFGDEYPESEYALKFHGCEDDPMALGTLNFYRDKVPREYLLAGSPEEFSIPERKELSFLLYSLQLRPKDTKLFSGEIEKQRKKWEEEKQNWRYVIMILPLKLGGVDAYLMPRFSSSLESRKKEFPPEAIQQREEWMLRFLIVFWKIGSALSILHQANHIFHRDLTPDNIFFINFWDRDAKESGWSPMIGDFGIAREADHTRTQIIRGKEHYMPPDRKDHDGKCDTYALGVIMDEVFGPNAPKGVRDIVDRAKSDTPTEWYFAHELMTDLGNEIKPRLLHWTMGLIERKEWEAMAEWADYAWDLLPEGRRISLIEGPFRKASSEKVDLYLIPPAKDSKPFRDFCNHWIARNDPRIARVYSVQTRGEHHYLIFESVDNWDESLEQDIDLIRFAQREKSLFDLEGVDILGTLEMKNIAWHSGRIKLLPWHGESFALASPDGGNISGVRHLGWLLKKLWTQCSRKTDDEGNELDKEYLDELTSILGLGTSGAILEVEELIVRLAKKVQERRVCQLQKEITCELHNIETYHRLLDSYRKEKNLNVDSHPEFYRVCSNLIRAKHGYNAQGIRYGYWEKVQGLNESLEGTGIREVLSLDVFIKEIQQAATSALEELENFDAPVSLCSFPKDEWKSMFSRISPYDIALSNLTGENIYCMEVDDVCYLFRQRFQPVTPLEYLLGKYGGHFEEACSLLNGLWKKVCALKEYVQKDYVLSFRDVSLDEHQEPYFDWLSSGSGKQWGEFVVQLLYGKEFSLFLLAIPLLFEKQEPGDTFPRDFIERLQEEHPEVQRMAPHFSVFNPVVPRNAWKREVLQEALFEWRQIVVQKIGRMVFSLVHSSVEQRKKIKQEIEFLQGLVL